MHALGCSSPFWHLDILGLLAKQAVRIRPLAKALLTHIIKKIKDIVVCGQLDKVRFL